MREIIPLKKDIVFKTKIGVINDLNVDHDYKINDDLIMGTVALSGTYKMTEASVVEDDFFYTIPFSISISKRINKDTIKIEIDDFKYEIIKDTLKVEIYLELTCEEEETIIDNNKEELDNYINDYLEEIDDNKKMNPLDHSQSDSFNDNNILQNEINDNTNINNITNTIIDNGNKYYKYKIYIVRQGDTYESICTKYNVTLEDIKEYNDLDELNVGDKVIIPSLNE